MGRRPGANDVPNTGFPEHARCTVRLSAKSAAVFAWADDHARLVGHMGDGGWRMGGGAIRLESDDARGQALGSRLALRGRAFGLPLSVDEVIVEYRPPTSKVWQTIGEPTLWVIGAYRMGFALDEADGVTCMQVFIDYALPTRSRWLGKWLGAGYARWCTQRMAQDAEKVFSEAAIGSKTK